MVCNIGSTSFKFQLLDMELENRLASGYTERVGKEDAVIAYTIRNKKVFETTMAIPSHR